jgi:hypothetical protein
MKLLLRGSVPTVNLNVSRPSVGSASFSSDIIADVRRSGVALGVTGSVSFDSDIVVANPGNLRPDMFTGSVTFNGRGADGGVDVSGQPDAGSGWGVGLATQGYAPVIAGNPRALPGAGSVSIDEQTPVRKKGLFFESDAVTLLEGSISPTLTGSISFGSEAPDVFGPETVSPNTDLLVTTGVLPSLGREILAGVPDALSTAGAAPVVRRSSDTPTVGGVSLTGYAPIIDFSDFAPVVVISPIVGNRGTLIVNNDAGPEASHYEICDRTGWKMKVTKRQLQEQWDGLLVNPDFYDLRHPVLDGTKVSIEKRSGAERPDDTNRERWVDEEYPDGVDSDDL